MFKLNVIFFLQAFFWELASERVVYNIRKAQILRQDISWYDLHGNENLSNKLAE